MHAVDHQASWVLQTVIKAFSVASSKPLTHASPLIAQTHKYQNKSYDFLDRPKGFLRPGCLKQRQPGG